MQNVNISQEQVARAAAEGVKLLQDDERVNVPPSLALSGDFAVLVGCLSSLATGQAVLTNPEPPAAADAGGEEGGSEGESAEE